jgi:hypothetical protein
MKNNIFVTQEHTEKTTKINKPWLFDMPLMNVILGCPGTCRAKLRAPALSVASCKSHLTPVNYKATTGIQAQNMGQVVPSLNQNAFLVAVGLSVQDEERESINLVSGFADVEDCEGTLHWSACTLQSAIGEYEVRIENNAVSLESLAPRIVAIANNTAVSHEYHPMKGGYPSTLASVIYLGNVKWNAIAAYYNINGTIRDEVAGGGA